MNFLVWNFQILQLFRWISKSTESFSHVSCNLAGQKSDVHNNDMHLYERRAFYYLHKSFYENYGNGKAQHVSKIFWYVPRGFHPPLFAFVFAFRLMKAEIFHSKYLYIISKAVGFNWAWELFQTHSCFMARKETIWFLGFKWFNRDSCDEIIHETMFILKTFPPMSDIHKLFSVNAFPAKVNKKKVSTINFK